MFNFKFKKQDLELIHALSKEEFDSLVRPEEKEEDITPPSLEKRITALESAIADLAVMLAGGTDND